MFALYGLKTLSPSHIQSDRLTLSQREFLRAVGLAIVGTAFDACNVPTASPTPGKVQDVFQGCCSFLPIWAQKGYLLDLRRYVQADLDQTRYQTFDALTAYAYGVASTVGSMSMHIIGYSGDEAIPYAIKLGDIAALDLPNVYYDVVFIHFVLHDIPISDRARIVNELVSKLTDHGKLFVREPLGFISQAEIHRLMRQNGLGPNRIRDCQYPYARNCS